MSVVFHRAISMIFPNIDTNRLALSEIDRADAEDVLGLFSSERVIEYYDLDAFTDIEQSIGLINLFESRYETSAGIRWAIRPKGTGKLVGTCGFNSWSSKMQSAVVGYDLLPEYWGKGYAAEALRAILKTAFSGVLPCGPINRVQADTVPGNIASEALLRKVGFKEEGVRRQSGYWKNSFHDLKCFGLLRADFDGTSGFTLLDR